MCGLAGVIAWDERYRVSVEQLAAMSAAIAHRGPDGQGLYVSPDAPITPARPQIALAHRRLAILDPDPRANQPFTDGSGRWIVFNGEIYNFRELRQTLSKIDSDYAWRTTGDTEVLLRAYDAWGSQCVEHLNGMFAFAVWDESKQLLYLARDRMGQKPLYLARPTADSGATALAFASELSSFSALPWFTHTVQEPSIAAYLQYGYLGHDATIFTQSTKLPPATWMRVEQGRAASGVYFDPNATPGGSPPATAAEFRKAIVSAVGKQLVSDAPLGCFLSGGVDSSVIVAAVRAAAPSGPLHTFSLGFDDARYDESEHAAKVAAHFRTEHHSFRMAFDAAAELPRLAAVFGEPFADSSALPTSYLAQQTRLHVKVALSGDGGDELFGGYERYRAMGHDRLLRRVPAAVRRAAARLAGSRAGSAHPKSLASKLARLMATVDQPPAVRYGGYLRFFSDAAISELLGRSASGHEDRVRDTFERTLAARDAMMAGPATDRVTYLPDDLLAKVDRASMLHALEVRSPLMDHDVVARAAGLNASQLMSGGPKRMLREAFANDLPPWVFRRRKMGFAVPIGEWFRTSLRSMLHDHLFASDSFASRYLDLSKVRQLAASHESRTADHSQRLYALLMLELWWRTMRR